MSSRWRRSGWFSIRCRPFLLQKNRRNEWVVKLLYWFHCGCVRWVEGKQSKLISLCSSWLVSVLLLPSVCDFCLSLVWMIFVACISQKNKTTTNILALSQAYLLFILFIFCHLRATLCNIVYITSSQGTDQPESVWDWISLVRFQCISVNQPPVLPKWLCI